MAVGGPSKRGSKPAGEALTAQEPAEPASRREQILQAAQKLFADKGWNAVATMREASSSLAAHS